MLIYVLEIYPASVAAEYSCISSSSDLIPFVKTDNWNSDNI